MFVSKKREVSEGREVREEENKRVTSLLKQNLLAIYGKAVNQRLLTELFAILRVLRALRSLRVNFKWMRFYKKSMGSLPPPFFLH